MQLGSGLIFAGVAVFVVLLLVLATTAKSQEGRCSTHDKECRRPSSQPSETKESAATVEVLKGLLASELELAEQFNVPEKFLNSPMKPLLVRNGVPCQYSVHRTAVPQQLEGVSSIVVIIHGLGDTSSGWSGVARTLSKRLPDTLFVVPTAPVQSSTANNGREMHSWYDIASLRGFSLAQQQDGQGILESSRYIQMLLMRFAKPLGVPSTSIVISGFSQGAVVSCAVALTVSERLAGAVMMGGYLGGRDAVLDARRAATLPLPKQRLFLIHGALDNLIPMDVAVSSREALAAIYSLPAEAIPLKVFDDMHHPPTEEALHEFMVLIRRRLEPSAA